MKNRYDFRMDEPQPSSERIAQHQDFDALMQAFEAQGAAAGNSTLRRLLPWMASAAAIAAAIWFFRLSYTPASHALRQEAYFASQPFVNPPLDEVQLPFSTYTIDAHQGGVLEFENGSRLTIPAAAFLDERGELIGGDIQIKYREMHDFVDFFLAGLPMHYDSAGTRYQMESAGMVEVYAEKGGKRLQLHPDKSLDVELVSSIIAPQTHLDVPPGYNIYRLNVAERRWEFHGMDHIAYLHKSEDDPALLLNSNPEQFLSRQLYEQMERAKNEYQREKERLEARIPLPPRPEKPTRANGSDFVFDFNFEDEDIDWSGVMPDDPNLSEERRAQIREKYKNALYQIAPDAEIDEELLGKVEWDDARLKRLTDRRFELTLIKGSSSLSVVVNPVLSPEEYEAALQEYEAELTVYNEALAARNEQLSEPLQALRQELEAEQADLKAAYEEKLTRYRDRGADFLADHEVVRRKVKNTFRISELGIWNCDRLISPADKSLEGSFVANGFEEVTGFIVDQRQNTIYRFFAYDGCEIPLPDDSPDHLLWLVNPDDRIAVFRPEQFHKLQPGNARATLVMDIIENHLVDESDVREVLYF